MPPTMNSPQHSPPGAILGIPAADPVADKAPRAAPQPGAGGRGKKPAFGSVVRVWSEADEVRILEGLAAYAAAHGAPPARSQLHAALEGRGLDKAEFTVTEIYEKVRRLRLKYCKLRDAGGPPAPGAAGDDGGGEEVRKYELSKAIWGDQQLNVAVPKKRGSAGTGVDADAVPPEGGVASTRVRRGFEELQDLFPCLAATVEKITNDEMLVPVLKRAFELIDDEEAGQLDAKVKKQMLMEVKMTINQTDLRNEVLETLIESMD
ncbi:unnamed protein product [Urochloa decumbens]|uniref:Glabrous enhancer-binding protein-like DBD domain-containing protein n=1 Tax=Urochloa decumbens TaxID=240449 RepID=A0ABC9DBD8_9POAL